MELTTRSCPGGLGGGLVPFEADLYLDSLINNKLVDLGLLHPGLVHHETVDHQRRRAPRITRTPSSWAAACRRTRSSRTPAEELRETPAVRATRSTTSRRACSATYDLTGHGTTAIPRQLQLLLPDKGSARGRPRLPERRHHRVLGDNNPDGSCSTGPGSSLLERRQPRRAHPGERTQRDAPTAVEFRQTAC